MKKKILIALGTIVFIALVVVVFMFGKVTYKDKSQLTEEELQYAETADSVIQQLQQQAPTITNQQLSQMDEASRGAFQSWIAAKEDLGDYVKTTGYYIKKDKKQIVVDCRVEGTELNPKGNARTAIVETIFTETGVTLTVNIELTMGEKMTNAGLNTVLGMGTVFAILILICFIISGFTLISKFENRNAKKETKVSDTSASVDNTIAQIIENEELTDDFEIAAVISAAIAAYEADAGFESADGVVIRSIRKVNKSKWQNA